jgi:hypothetical protein
VLLLGTRFARPHCDGDAEAVAPVSEPSGHR